MEGDGSVPNNRPAPAKHFSWIRRSLPIAAASLAAFCLVATPAAAQDVPWGHKADSKKTDKKKPAQKPKQEAKKAPAKAPANKAVPTTKKSVSDTAKKGPAPAEAKKEPVANDPTAQDGKTNVAAGDDLIEHFKKELAPHGKWVKDETHGDVWVPNPATVGTEWAPYRDHGHWAVTDQGDWAWVSDMAWGKIPFHYGRWVWTPKQNWMWKPGSEHAPAWVVWRVADANRKFVGWAPMAPEATDGAKTVLPFYFVPTRYLFSPHIDKFVISNQRLAQKMHGHSHIFGGHAVDASPKTDAAGDASTTNAKTAAKDTAKDTAANDTAAKGDEDATKEPELQPASPTFTDVIVPAFAMPKTKLPSTDEAVAPVISFLKAVEATPVKTDAASEDSVDEGRFATPPPSDETSRDQRLKQAKKRGARKARQSRSYRNWQKNRPRYRCWWTNTRPRIWRCGY